MHPDTGRVYVASLDDATVSVIDPATSTVTATIPVGTRPEGMALHARLGRLYVPSNPQNGTLYVLNSSSNSVAVVEP
ncbi:MAG TPA: hypothetical protein VHW44_13640 [Pseudonocardiaceae bacterium]|nr:hypothetical protein [Pseudonocardiaceae bacterium]